MKIILECEHKNINECKDCPISVFNKYNKALEFIKHLQKKSQSSNYIYTLDEKEIEKILKEIGEL